METEATTEKTEIAENSDNGHEPLFELKGKDNPEIDGLFFASIPPRSTRNDKRVYATHLLIKDGFAVGATRGRLHRYELSMEVADGLYRILKAQKTHVILYRTSYDPEKHFPGFESLFDTTAAFEIDANLTAEHSGMVKMLRSLPEELFLNLNYLKDLGDLSYRAYYTDAESQVVFECGKRSAVIMPLRH